MSKRTDLEKRDKETMFDWIGRLYRIVEDGRQAGKVDGEALEALLGLVPLLLCMAGTAGEDKLIAVKKIPSAPTGPICGRTCSFTPGVGFTLTLDFGN